MHRALGVGLYESVYEPILADELETRGLEINRPVSISVEYDGIQFGEGFKTDLIVENKVILELTSVETLHAAYRTK